MKDKIKVVRKSKHHKHRESIISWANGAEIEYGHNGEWFPAKRPAWLTSSVYRIKPTEPTELEKLIKEHKAMGKTIDRLTKELTK